ncbi:hypothetical protein HELRODRAFT_156641 [Helobdella robusta]|uniref:MPN domain-containing protein n=1 Tax=Helobdella robusta TaxID=6412 RepID=T1ELZ1_HELRO|nr:hypothetical protein HELRODRAFT_156641 [Helobdella robusta]ESO08049.1 hypothetical protein HELRODRAFT_156641 [Helobdella robusta]
MENICMNARSFVKPLLHAAKYPHCYINGVFLAECPKQKDGKVVLEIKDCIPLFHSHLTLAPMLEVALIQIDAYCQCNDLVIAGYYQANEVIFDKNPTNITYRIAEKVKDNFNEAFFLMIDNERLADDDGENAYILYNNYDGKWKKVLIEKDVIDVAQTLIQTKAFRDVIDFDNHLTDISLKWHNPQINEQIEQCI